jgi:thiol-disulfide isomerase/thioredoxin
MRLGLLGLLLLSLPAIAGDLRPFDRGSRAAIEQAHAGKPFVLAFWSVDCAYCPEEMRHLGALVRQRPDIKLVLVSTDGTEMNPAAAAKLAEYLPDGQGERWIFAGDDPDRLYFAIDRKWHGELPRTYFYDGAGGVRAMSGQVDAAWLANWVRGVGR